MATLAEVEASIRASTDQGDTGRTPQSVIYQFVNDDYQDLARRLAAFAPQQWSKISAEFVIATGGSSIDISSITDLLQITEVQYKSSDKWISLRPAEYNAELNSFHTTWEQQGFPGSGCKVNIYPDTRAPGTYRIKYVRLVATLTTGSDILALPPGGECVLIHTVSGRIRVREEEDPSAHFALAEKAFDGLKQNLTPKYGVIGSRAQYR